MIRNAAEAEAQTKRFSKDIMFKVEDNYHQILGKAGDDDIMVSDEDNPLESTVYIPSTFPEVMDKMVKKEENIGKKKKPLMYGQQNRLEL